MAVGLPLVRRWHVDHGPSADVRLSGLVLIAFDPDEPEMPTGSVKKAVTPSASVTNRNADPIPFVTEFVDCGPT
jgi:hypothetical protein